VIQPQELFSFGRQQAFPFVRALSEQGFGGKHSLDGFLMSGLLFKIGSAEGKRAGKPGVVIALFHVFCVQGMGKRENMHQGHVETHLLPSLVCGKPKVA